MNAQTEGAITDPSDRMDPTTTRPAGTAVATTPAPTRALARASQTALLRPIAEPADILAAQNETRSFLEAALVEGRDYGTFPGVDKKSLFKAGAERSALAFGLMPRHRIQEQEVDHNILVPWRKVKGIFDGPRGNRTRVGEEVQVGESLGLYRYVVECELIDRHGEVRGAALASCSTLESKYIDRPRDSENTVLQMAEKRAFVAAIRTTLGLSEQFTQDIEDDPDRYNKLASGGGHAAAAAADENAVACPKCKGAMWDNRATNEQRVKEGKKRMPDYKCKNKACEDVIWSASEYARELEKNANVGAPDPAAHAMGAADHPSSPEGEQPPSHAPSEGATPASRYSSRFPVAPHKGVALDAEDAGALVISDGLLDTVGAATVKKLSDLAKPPKDPDLLRQLAKDIDAELFRRTG